MYEFVPYPSHYVSSKKNEESMEESWKLIAENVETGGGKTAKWNGALKFN
jgi:hypothetical protein